jgi:membrane-associated phospholipid phosphatase
VPADPDDSAPLPDRSARPRAGDRVAAARSHWSSARLSWLAALLFVALAGIVISGRGRPIFPDEALHQWAAVHRSPGVTAIARVVTATGIGLPALLLAALAGAVAVRARGAILAVIVLLSGQLLRRVLVDAIGRARPPHHDWAAFAGGQAFPSGHTTSVTIVAVLLGAALPRWDVRTLVLVWAITVGLTRVYLGVHWPTDVVGGWLLGFVWATTAVRLMRGTTR